jgi:glycosidase
VELDDFIFGPGREEALAAARARRSGVCHGGRRRPRDPLPGEGVTLELTVGPAEPADGAWVEWAADRQPRRGDRMAMDAVGVAWDELAGGYVRAFQAVVPGQPEGTIVRYRLGADGEKAADGDAVFAYAVDDGAPPDWARDAVVYHVFADRFTGTVGTNDFGSGTLRGITERLDYVADLGANTIWLSPIFPSPSYHGYDATDLFGIEPRLGSIDDFRELVDTAHGLGLRVLLDFVPNHWSNQHPTFIDATTNEGSPYRDWYVFRHWPDDYASFLDAAPDLPKINLRHEPARTHVLESAQHWLELGADGFRVDHTIGPSPDFWADFRRVTRATDPQSWIFGEAIVGPDQQLAFEGLLDGSLDFALCQMLRATFALGTHDCVALASFLDRHEAFFPETFSRPSFLDNHDMDRFLFRAGGDARRLRLAALCQFTLAGAPIVYYGTEVGLSQTQDIRDAGWGGDREARRPMLWDGDQDRELLAFYRELIRLRRDEPALRRGSRRTIAATATTLSYAREDLVVTIDLETLSGQLHRDGMPIFATDLSTERIPWQR